MPTPARPNPASRGFTLVELTIVLVIVGLLVGGMTVLLSAAQDTANIKETQRRLNQAQEALLGFAAGSGRLPCPAAAPIAGGVEAPSNGTGACTAALDGFLPGTTLGLSPTDEQGYFVDAWGNRIRYAVYNTTIAAETDPFTTAGKMKSIGIETLSTNPSPTPRKLLYVCDSATGITGTTCGTARTLTDTAVAVVFSMGKNGGVAAAGDEAANTDGDVVFVSMTAATFDDLVTWLSPNILYNRMIAAGRF
ncbi:MAG: type II secretion system GspH family protein [Rhodocyclaceae bacterium]|nr:type II secretion system GspH family protein [Rhodocyclaceae bacterium]